MSSRRRVVGLVVVTVVSVGALGSTTAGAVEHQGGGGSGSSALAVTFGGPNTKLLAEYDIPLTATGELSIDFHGDRSAGCGRWGLCAYRGRITLPPPRGGTIFVSKFRRHGRTVYRADLALGTGYSGAGFASHTSRLVNGKASGLCADGQNYPIFTGSEAKDGRLTVTLLQAGGGALSTRCAGPLDGDVSRASPRATVSVARLLRGGGQISLTGIHRFSSHGFAGTVNSTIVLRLGTARRQRHINRAFPKGAKTTRIRTIVERLRLVRGSGGLRFALRGSTNPTVCQLLDSCDLRGAMSLTAVLAHGTGELSASGLASRPRRDLLTALGLAHGGNPKGVLVMGTVSWKDRGFLTERVTQSATCSDRVGLGSGFVSMYSAGSALDATFVPSTLRTRCPGPMLESNLGSLAGATLTRRLLSRPRFTINIQPTHSLTDDGYSVHPSGHISVTVTRTGHTTEHVFRVPKNAVFVFTRGGG